MTKIRSEVILAVLDEKQIPICCYIKMLGDIVSEYDPGKLFLPTSASGPNEFLNIEKPGKNHDVHGNWKYVGTSEHYKIFNMSDSLFHSEFGVDGCSSIESLRKILSPTNLVITDVKKNLVWRHILLFMLH